MRKRLIMIGASLLVCALVAVGIYVVLGFDPIEPPPEENLDFGLVVNDEQLKVYKFAPASVDYMEIKNSHETYRVRMDEGKVVVVGYENMPLVTASATGLFNSVSTLTLDTVVDKDCQNLDRFGLANPQAEITIQSYQGSSYTFHIGNASLDNRYYYMCEEGGTTVYLMDEFFAARYLKSIKEYCDPKIYKTFVPSDDFRALTVKSPTVNYSFRMATEEEKKFVSRYFSGIAMDAPFSWGVEADAIDAVMTSMVALSAKEIVAVCLPEEELVQYGLDAASCTQIVLSVYADPNPITYNGTANLYFDSTLPTGTYSDFNVTYRIGKTVDRKTYVMFDNRPVVYLVDETVFSWIDWSPYRYCTKMLYGEYLDKVSSLSVISGDLNVTFNITGAGTNDRDDLRVNAGSISVDNDSFRTFYGNLISMYPSGDAVGADTSGTPVLTVVYNLSDGTSHTLKFYSMDDRNCAADVDGQTFLSVRITEVQKILNDTNKLLNGQQIN
jgi:hypothetical protein